MWKNSGKNNQKRMTGQAYLDKNYFDRVWTHFRGTYFPQDMENGKNGKTHLIGLFMVQKCLF
jgi:hypothetical protein